MYFMIFAVDKVGKAELRQHIRPSHRDYLKNKEAHGVTVHVGGPTLTADGTTMNGTLLGVEAESLQQVEEFVANDPYSHADMFASIEIRPWSWSLGNPVQQL